MKLLFKARAIAFSISSSLSTGGAEPSSNLVVRGAARLLRDASGQGLDWGFHPDDAEFGRIEQSSINGTMFFIPTSGWSAYCERGLHRLDGEKLRCRAAIAETAKGDCALVESYEIPSEYVRGQGFPNNRRRRVSMGIRVPHDCDLATWVRLAAEEPAYLPTLEINGLYFAENIGRTLETGLPTWDAFLNEFAPVSSKEFTLNFRKGRKGAPKSDL
jgi:hypothetical protein